MSYLNNKGLHFDTKTKALAKALRLILRVYNANEDCYFA